MGRRTTNTTGATLVPEFALSNKINHAHERIDALERGLAQGADAVTRADLDALRAEVAKLRNEIQGLKMRMGKKAA